MADGEGNEQEAEFAVYGTEGGVDIGIDPVKRGGNGTHDSECADYGKDPCDR